MSTILASYGSCVNSVLIATANEQFRNLAIRRLGESNWRVEIAHGGAEALGKLETFPSRLMLLDRNLPDLQPCDVVEMVEARYPGVDVVLVNTETGETQASVEGRSSAVYQLLDALDVSVEVAPASGVKAEIVDDELPGIIGSSEVMRRIARLVRLVSRRDTTVLITGETGTGKELIAQAVHRLSPRASGPYVTVNCAAIPESLLEAELFGHTKGAFTGAVQSRVGKIHSAQGGTIFLDEIGEMLPAMQAKLLRFLENSEVQRLGSSDVFKVDVRVVAATNCRLLQKVQRGEFREDLYYRLAVFPIEMPALRMRGDDLKELAWHFARHFGDEQTTVSEQASAMLQAHGWPGNVRELKHVMERATILADGDDVIRPEHVNIGSIAETSMLM